mgnify:CR=1 FL=1
MSDIKDIIGKSQASAKTATPAFTYADLIVDYLSQIDVEYVFGIPGGAIEGLFDALARRHKGEIPQTSVHHSRALERKRSRSVSGPQMVVARHETGAAFMADGYARSTGKLGVCCSTTGPGATNLLTGVANAYVDRVPMLVITPQTALPSFGQRGFQESSSDLVDVVSIFDHCTRYSSLVSHPDQLEGKLFTALSTAFRRPRGPVHLSIKNYERTTDIPWLHKQWIKNDIMGDEYEAVELFPAESRLVNTANQYHLWCFKLNKKNDTIIKFKIYKNA